VKSYFASTRAILELFNLPKVPANQGTGEVAAAAKMDCLRSTLKTCGAYRHSENEYRNDVHDYESEDLLA